ncbi:hypothetical protein JCM10213_007916 [Rhodosporidiobolus nylandii]
MPATRSTRIPSSRPSPASRKSRSSKAAQDAGESDSEDEGVDEGDGKVERDEFNQKVYDMVRRIPEGQVASYGLIARLISHPRHSRMVGSALKCLPRSLSSPVLIPARPAPPSPTSSAENGADDEEEVMPEPEPNPDFVPWHRVLSSSGVISPRGSIAAVERQADYLRAEGVEVVEGPRNGRAGGEGQQAAGVDAFGLGGAVAGGRVSMSRYGWKGP